MNKFNAIDPSRYDPTPLNKSIEELCDPKNPLDDAKVASLVWKYMVWYIYPESFDQKVELNQINKILETGFNYYSYQKQWFEKSIEKLRIKSPDIIKIIEYCSYQIDMLSDIAPSTDIFKDIASRKLQSELFDNSYVGLDIGTWSGLLVLPMYIHAMRNSFESVHIYGIDLEEYTIQQSQQLLSNCLWGNVISIKEWDATDSHTYKTLEIDKPITFITSELIPNEGMHMDTQSDPYYRSYAALYRALDNWSILSNTWTFPQKLEISNSKTQKSIIGTHHNRFEIEAILWDDGRYNLLHHKVKAITINQISTPLSLVWKRLLENWLVSRNRNWHQRW